MNDNDSLPKKAPGTDWQILGELKLSIDASVHSVAGRWVAETLSPLDLQKDFMNKVLKSAQDVVARAVQAESVRASEHLHLSIFVSQDQISGGRTWGFFRIEKLEGALADENDLDHAIEFYLYPEG